MVDMKEWMEQFTLKIQQEFKEQVVFIGLQGSRAREEANDTSDIDVVVIFDELTMDTVAKYKDVTQTMPNRELLCGFISGKEELLNWEKAELFQFYYDTIPMVGSLDFIKPLIQPEDIQKAVRTGAGTIYHMVLHNYLHAKAEEAIPALYKMAIFVLQAKHFLQTNNYVQKKKDLVKVLQQEDQPVLARYLAIQLGTTIQLEADTKLLFEWAKQTLNQLK